MGCTCRLSVLLKSFVGSGVPIDDAIRAVLMTKYRNLMRVVKLLTLFLCSSSERGKK
jgi:hypothetical protein